NVLITTSLWSATGISIRLEDFVVLEQDILVRNYYVQNTGPGHQEVQFFYVSDLAIGGPEQKKDQPV
ncbi:MAG TPA: hypothetical protein VHS59_14510, partial [Bacillota bacterium]|nr:hypothetical protein [Bacillota bacterium]